MSKRLNETQIVGILQVAEASTPVPERWRKYGLGNRRFDQGRSKYGTMEVADVKGLKALEAENRRLKQGGAGLNLNSQMQEEIIKKLSGWRLELYRVWRSTSALGVCQVL